MDDSDSPQEPGGKRLEPDQVGVSKDTHLFLIEGKGSGIDLIRLEVLHRSNHFFAAHCTGENSILTSSPVLNDGNSFVRSDIAGKG